MRDRGDGIRQRAQPVTGPVQLPSEVPSASYSVAGFTLLRFFQRNLEHAFLIA